MFQFEAPWQPVLDFWFGDGLVNDWPSTSRAGFWFRADPALDAEIRERFEPLVEAALWNELVDWEAKPLSRLALVVLLDQFTRNIHRGTPRAYAGDHRAVTLVVEGMARDMDRRLPRVGQAFFYMPLMHAEDESLQEECVRRFETLLAEAPESMHADIRLHLDVARKYREIIRRFGRFPHRNRLLERESTPEEREWLAGPDNPWP